MTDNSHYQSPVAAPGRTGLSDDDVARVRIRRGSDRSPHTVRAYDRADREWREWLQARVLDASSLALQVYLEERIAGGWSLASVRAAIAGISAERRKLELPSLTAAPDFIEYVRAVSRSIGAPQRQARPLTADVLALIAELCDPLTVATCALMRDALLRVGEAAALRWRHVTIELEGGLVWVARSKGDREGRGKTLFIGAPTVRLLGEIARRPDDTVLRGGPATLYRRIRQAGIDAGLGDGYSGHSPRVGMAQDLAAAGVPMAALMEVGRWRHAETALRYIENQEAQRSAVAHYYGVSP